MVEEVKTDSSHPSSCSLSLGQFGLQLTNSLSPLLKLTDRKEKNKEFGSLSLSVGLEVRLGNKLSPHFSLSVVNSKEADHSRLTAEKQMK